jgi:hypothetical protein
MDAPLAPRARGRMSAAEYEQKARRLVRLALQTQVLIRRNRLLSRARSWLALAVDEAIPRAVVSSFRLRPPRHRGRREFSSRERLGMKD